MAVNLSHMAETFVKESFFAWMPDRLRLNFPADWRHAT
jgi:hypothetical protein